MFSRTISHWQLVIDNWSLRGRKSLSGRCGSCLICSWMKLLVIGSGGREHALVWKLAQSPRMSQMWCVPGNAGIAQERLAANQALVECVNIGAEDLPRLLAFAQE